jgi:hypothetical protein
MSLNNFDAATSLVESMQISAQYVRITAGQREGTVGMVMDHKSEYYSSHEYRIKVRGRRSFWIKGSELLHLKNWDGGTNYVQRTEVPRYNDLMGRQIDVGHTIYFPRGTEGALCDMIMGTVKKISDKGTIYVKVFMNSQGGELVAETIRVGRPSQAMIIDKGMFDQVLLAKLSM